MSDLGSRHSSGASFINKPGSNYNSVTPDLVLVTFDFKGMKQDEFPLQS